MTKKVAAAMLQNTESEAPPSPAAKPPRVRKRPAPVLPTEICADAVVSLVSVSEPEPEPDTEPASTKKRGRKPKGGKLIVKNPGDLSGADQIPNVIMHLNCSLADLAELAEDRGVVQNSLVYNPTVPPEIRTYNTESGDMFYCYDTRRNAEGGLGDAAGDEDPGAPAGPGVCDDARAEPEFDIAYKDCVATTTKTHPPLFCARCGTDIEPAAAPVVTPDPVFALVEDRAEISSDVAQKLRRLKIAMYKNVPPENKSACFWCTCDYDTPECYIPKSESDGVVFGYGSFCRPECAVAFLMKESLDDSAKFERYTLLNRIYGRLCNYKKNIKPAPNPFYLLDKFCGTLTIQEYRKLLKTDHIFLVVDKPLTRVLPELHEDTDDFVLNIYGAKASLRGGGGVAASGGSSVCEGAGGGKSRQYKVRQQSDVGAGVNKNTIIRSHFGVLGVAKN